MPQSLGFIIQLDILEGEREGRVVVVIGGVERWGQIQQDFLRYVF